MKKIIKKYFIIIIFLTNILRTEENINLNYIEKIENLTLTKLNDIRSVLNIASNVLKIDISLIKIIDDFIKNHPDLTTEGNIKKASKVIRNDLLNIKDNYNNIYKLINIEFNRIKIDQSINKDNEIIKEKQTEHLKRLESYENQDLVMLNNLKPEVKKILEEENYLSGIEISEKYYDKVSVDGKITIIDTKLDTQRSEIENNINQKYSEVNSKLDTQKSEIKDISEKIKTQENNINEKYSEVNSKLDTQKSEIENNINQRLQNQENNISENYYNKTEVYNITEVNKKLDIQESKINDINEKIKTQRLEIENNINQKYSEVNSKLNTQKSEIENNINQKLQTQKTDIFEKYYNRSEVDDRFKTERSEIENNVSEKYYNKVLVDEKINTINTKLETQKSEIENNINQRLEDQKANIFQEYYNKSEVDEKIQKLNTINIDPKIVSDIAKLSKENESLKDKILYISAISGTALVITAAYLLTYVRKIKKEINRQVSDIRKKQNQKVLKTA